MQHPRFFIHLPMALLLCLIVTMPASAKSAAYQTGFARWRAWGSPICG